MDRSIGIRISEELLQKTRDYAKAHQISISAVIRLGLVELFNRGIRGTSEVDWEKWERERADPEIAKKYAEGINKKLGINVAKI